MWYKKKRFITAIVTAALVALGALTGVDLSGLEAGLTEAACGIVECVQ